MPEHVVVTYPESRIVRVNRSGLGKTNKKIRVSSGPNTFDLGAPADYEPPSQTVNIQGTDIRFPLEIAFTPRVAMVAAAPLAAAAAPSAATAAPAAEMLASAHPSEAVASQQSDMFHLSLACPAAAMIVGANAVFGDQAREGRTLHEGCMG